MARISMVQRFPRRAGRNPRIGVSRVTFSPGGCRDISREVAGAQLGRLERVVPRAHPSRLWWGWKAEVFHPHIKRSE